MNAVQSESAAPLAPVRLLRSVFGGRDVRQRILDAADPLFYSEGIKPTAIDHIVEDAGVTKSSLYRYFESKDVLAADYLAARHEKDVAMFSAMSSAGLGAPEMLRLGLDDIIKDLHDPLFRGCAFINAAAEYSDPTHPIRIIIRRHREWYTDVITGLLRTAGHPLAGDAADDLLMARDGGMSSVYGGDSVSAIAAMNRAIERALSGIVPAADASTAR